MTSTTLDELDSLLEEYLSLLDTYQSLQLSLESTLKSAYFNLAKSKIALGPHRLSQKGWDLKQKDSFLQVVIQQGPVQSYNREGTTTETTVKENTALNYSIQHRTSSLPSDTIHASAASPESTLRQRSQPPTSPSSSLSPDETSFELKPKSPPPAPAPAPAPSPLHQFSSLPPPVLRASAKGFESSLDKILGLVEVEAKLRGLAKKIKGVKKRLKAEEREGKGECTVGRRGIEEVVAVEA